jgi:hypothetical protein
VESSIAVIVGSLPPLKAFITRTLERTRDRSKVTGGSNSRANKYRFDPQEEQSLSKSQARVGSIPLEDWSSSMSRDPPVKAEEGHIIREREYY